jgi:hypothetical protein
MKASTMVMGHSEIVPLIMGEYSMMSVYRIASKKSQGA